MDPSLLRCRPAGARHPDWRRLYETQDPTTMPWYSGALDPDLLAVLPAAPATFLDIGCGPGSQAAELSARGFVVTGTDLSAAAVERAGARYAGVTFLEDDIVRTRLTQPFDYAFDRGCLHVLDRSDHGAYVTSVAALVRPGGTLFLKCFSDAEPPADFGPLRFSEADIRRLFATSFHVESLRRTRYHGPATRAPHALFATLRRARRG